MPSEWHGTVYPSSWDPTNVHLQSYKVGATAFANVSLRPDAFRSNSTDGRVPSIVQTRQLRVWSWVENLTCELELASCVYWSIANDLRRRYCQSLRHFWIKSMLRSIFGLSSALSMSTISQLWSRAIMNSIRGLSMSPSRIRQHLSLDLLFHWTRWRPLGLPSWIFCSRCNRILNHTHS